MGSVAILQGGTDGSLVFDDIWSVKLNPRETPPCDYHPKNQILQWKKIGKMAEGAFFHDSAGKGSQTLFYGNLVTFPKFLKQLGLDSLTKIP